MALPQELRGPACADARDRTTGGSSAARVRASPRTHGQRQVVCGSPFAFGKSGYTRCILVTSTRQQTSCRERMAGLLCKLPAALCRRPPGGHHAWRAECCIASRCIGHDEAAGRCRAAGGLAAARGRLLPVQWAGLGCCARVLQRVGSRRCVAERLGPAAAGAAAAAACREQGGKCSGICCTSHTARVAAGINC